MPIEGIDYRLVFASDVNPRDGLGLECWRGEQPLFEVFRDDAGRRFVVNLFASDVPLELLDPAETAAPLAISRVRRE